MHRHEFLVALGFGLAEATTGLARFASPATAQASTIMIRLSGGPSHIDLWDLKPDAPRKIRGEFRPISTFAPDITLCKHLPHLAMGIHNLVAIHNQNRPYKLLGEGTSIRGLF